MLSWSGSTGCVRLTEGPDASPPEVPHTWVVGGRHSWVTETTHEWDASVTHEWDASVTHEWGTNIPFTLGALFVIVAK